MKSRCINIGLLIIGLNIVSTRLEPLAIYPVQGVCPEESKQFPGKRYSEKEIRDGCNGFNYAEIEEQCGMVKCCNNLDLDSDYVPVLHAPKMQKLCPSSTWKNGMQGAFDGYDSNIKNFSTLFVLKSHLHEVHATHDFIGCVHHDLVQNATAGPDDALFAAFMDDNYTRSFLDIEKFRFRIWDLSNDCFNNYYDGAPFPIGGDLTLVRPNGLAIYCKKGLEACKKLIIPSEPGAVIPAMPVDTMFRQDKCVYNASLLDPLFDELDLSEEFAGQYKCFEECKQQNFELAMISESMCICTFTER